MSEENKSGVLDVQFDQILAATDGARFLEARQMALEAGFFEEGSSPDQKLLAGRLAGHLGNSSLYWKLTARAHRLKPNVARFQTQRIYAMMEKRGAFAAWQAASRLSQAECESDRERAEALICQGSCAVIFRDLSVAEDAYSRAQQLDPHNPWIWSESSSLAVERGDHLKALEYVDYALSLQPFYRSALMRKVGYLQALRRDDEALDILAEGVSKLQSYAVACQLAGIYSEREEWQKFLDLTNEAERLAPMASEALLEMFAGFRADALTGMGRYDEAIAEARKSKKNKFYEQLADRLEKDSTPQKRVKISVPFIRQDYNTCAPATLSAITTFWERPIPQETLIEQICYDGTQDFAERRWAEQSGWYVREFRVQWEVATQLLDRGVPFILTTVEIDSAHSQAVIGYDTKRRSLLIRDPSVRHHREWSYERFEEHYSPVGPRGFLILPTDKVSLLDGIELPESALYDKYYAISCALDIHDRARAVQVLDELHTLSSDHRIWWTAQRLLASYDQNVVGHLTAVDALLGIYPKDDRLGLVRLNLLRALGRQEEARELVKSRCQQKEPPPGLFWREYARELDSDARQSRLALRLSRRALRWNPLNLDNLACLADRLWADLYRPEALAVQRLAVCLGDKREGVTQCFFQMQLASGQMEEALQFLQQRSEAFLDKSGAPTLTWLHALEQLNRFQELSTAVDSVLTHRSQDGELRLYAAALAARQGNVDKSREHLALAEPISRRVNWLYAAAQAADLAGDFTQSLQLLVELTESSPLDMGAHRQIALLKARQDGKKAAQEYLRTVGERFPYHFELLQLEIQWLDGVENGDVAETRLRDYLVTNPRSTWAQRQLALCLQQKRLFEEALNLAQEAKRADLHNPDSWQVESVVLESMGRESEARECLKNSLRLNVNSDYAVRKLFALSNTAEEKDETLRLVRGHLDSQWVMGPSITAYREGAFALVELGELTGDLRHFQQTRSHLWEVWVGLTQQLVQSGKLEEALSVASEATTRFPLLPAVWQGRARVHRHLGQWAESVDCLKSALRINPAWTAAIYDLMEIYRRRGELDQAQQLLEQSRHRNPLDPVVLGNLADLLWLRGERETAIQHMVRTIELNPDYDWAWFTLSQWSQLIYKKDMALEQAHARAERLAVDAGAWLRIVQLAVKSEQANEQLQAAIRAREASPHFITAHDMVAVALTNQHRYDEARAACQPEIFKKKQPYNLRGRIAWIQGIEGKTVEAIQSMKAVLKENPHYYWGWEVLTNLQIKNSYLPQALESCQQMVRLNPVFHAPYLKRAEIQVGLSQKQEAIKDYERALLLEPSLIGASWTLLKLHLDQHDLAKATALLGIIRPYSAKGISLHAEALVAVHAKDFTRALTLFKEAAFQPEVDSGTLMDVVEALELEGQRGDLDRLLRSLLREPGLNPILAELWVFRFGEAHSWDLLKQYESLPQSTPIREAFLNRWLLASDAKGQVLKVARTIMAKCREVARQSILVWSRVGQALSGYGMHKEAVDWLKDWESRPDAQGWMVTNLVVSLQLLNRIPEADEISRKILDRGLRDNCAVYNLSYLAISALEQKQTALARQLYSGIYFENEADPHSFFERMLIKETLQVQEADTDPKRKEVYNAAIDKLRRQRSQANWHKRLIALDKRCMAVILRDAHGNSPVRLAAAKMVELPRAKAEACMQKSAEWGQSMFSLIPRFIGPIALLMLFVLPRACQPSDSGYRPSPVLPPSVEPKRATAKPLTQSAEDIQAQILSANQPRVSPVDLQSTAPNTGAQSFTENLERGRALMDAGRWAEALPRMLQAHQQRPSDPAITELYARNLHAVGRSEEASALTEQAATSSPDNPAALRAHGESLLIKKQFEESIKLLDRSIAIDPKISATWLLKGYAYSGLGQFDSAIESFAQALRLHPELAQPWVELVKCYGVTNRLLDGEDHLRKLLKEYPSAAPGWRVLASVQGDIGMVETSIETFKKSLSLRPEPDTWNGLGLSYAKSMKPDLAIDSFKQALKLDPKHVEAWNNLGYSYFIQGDNKQAQKAFQSALEANPRHVNALINLTRSYVKDGKIDLASEICDRLALIEPNLGAKIKAEIR